MSSYPFLRGIYFRCRKADGRKNRLPSLLCHANDDISSILILKIVGKSRNRFYYLRPRGNLVPTRLKLKAATFHGVTP